MTANTPVKSASAGDLINFRLANQAVKFGLAIHVPAVVYSAQVNQSFDSLDNVNYLEYDGGTGTLADVLAGMTCYVGTSAGARDKGVVRVRKAPTATRLYIGATSDILFADDDYLTVVDDFGLWGKEVQQDGAIIRMDTELTFTSRGAQCLIRAAPMVAIIKRVAGTATFTPPSPALSECYDGATIASWEYDAPGASATYNMTAGDGSAYWEYDTAGQYRWSLTITDSEGRTRTTHRWVFVDPTSPDFSISTNPSTDGGWSFGITMYDNAGVSEIVDRAMVTLYTVAEYFGGVEATIGKLAGYENIVCTGWIDGESIVRDSQQGTVTFSVYGALHWMQKIRASAMALENTTSTPTTWAQIENMTADKAMARILLDTSTAADIMDCFLTGDETLIDLLAQPAGSLYAQLEAAGANTIFTTARVNSLGQLFVEVDPQMMTSTQKAALITVMTITTADYETPLDIDRLTSGSQAMVELQCNSYDGVTVYPVYSRAPGNIGKRFGEFANPTNYYAADQDECNRRAGCLLAIANPQYTPLTVVLAHQNRLIDIAPAQYCQISIAAGDTIRGVVLTNQKLIPRRVTLNIQGGYYKTECEFELASSPTDGISYFPPQQQDDTIMDGIEFDPLSFDGIGAFPSPNLDIPAALPSIQISTPPDCKTSTYYMDAPPNSFGLNWDTNYISGGGDRIASAYFPCAIRRGDAQHKTSIYIAGSFNGNAKNYTTVYGVKGGARVITATSNFTNSGGYATFNPVASVDVDGFEIELDESSVGLGDIISTGTVDSKNESGLVISGLDIGYYYAFESAGGPYYVAGDWRYSYQFQINKSGRIGYSNFNWDGPMYATQLPAGTENLEIIGTYYGRVYFTASAESINFRVYDNPAGQWYNNSGTLGYILYATSGSINFSHSAVRNVCAL